MKREAVLGFMVTLIVVSMLTLAFNIQPAKSEHITIIVPDDYEKIQWAVDNASNGDTIFVRAGTYYEHVVVKKSVSLVGENRRTTTIDGGGDEAYDPYEYGYVVKIEANDLNITGFTMRNSRQTGRGAGLWLRSVNHCNVSYNNLINNFVGIQLDYSSHNTIAANNASSNNNRGIYLMDSCNNNLITKNNIASNNDDGIELMECSNNTIAGNNFSHNQVGIRLYASTGITNNNIIKNNTITNNSIVGIQLNGANHNTLVDNNISLNSFAGIRFLDCHDNTIYHNNFIDNTPQALDLVGDSVNFWDDGYPSGGNYWSDYSGEDRDGDGVGDTPYVIDIKNQDNFPLMNPWIYKKDLPFWTQLWFWLIITAGIVVLTGTLYFLKKRESPTPTSPTTPEEGTV